MCSQLQNISPHAVNIFRIAVLTRNVGWPASTSCSLSKHESQGTAGLFQPFLRISWGVFALVLPLLFFVDVREVCGGEDAEGVERSFRMENSVCLRVFSNLFRRDWRANEWELFVGRKVGVCWSCSWIVFRSTKYESYPFIMVSCR